jgi:photosynthetic reaction center M subunit
MATIISRPALLPLELPEPSRLDDTPLGIRIGTPFHIPLLARFGVSTQFGTIYVGFWGFMSLGFFLAGLGVSVLSNLDQAGNNPWLVVKYFANLQSLPPDNLGLAPSLRGGGYWQIIMAFWALSVLFWGLRCYERLIRFSWRPYLFFAFLSAVLLTTVIWVIRPAVMGTWSEAPGFGLNVDLDWAQNFSVLWGNLYYNPWHMLSIFFLFGSTMLWGMHGATILATANEASWAEVAEIKDMHSGSHKSMLFWRWTMGFNANPKTIHDWLYWFAVGVVVAGALGIITTGTVVKDWYVWGVDHGWVQQYGPITRSAVNERPAPMPAAQSELTTESVAAALTDYRPLSLYGILFEAASGQIELQSIDLVGVVGLALQQNPEISVTIQGHTDNVGSAATNLKLSQARAESFKALLVSKYGIAPSRLATQGYGETRPVASNDTEDGRAQNRRVEIVRN